MTLFLLLKLLHIVGATVLFGTGAGIAFFMLIAHRTGDAAAIAHVAGTVVLADTIFTATAVIVQPLTGWALAVEAGYGFEDWIAASLALYVLTGACWLPVVWIQMRLRTLASEAAAQSTALAPEYHRLFRIWLACGFPAFLSVLTILWLMLARPHFTLG